MDTACSSSLAGAHLGARDIAAGGSGAALAAGGNHPRSPRQAAAFAVPGARRSLGVGCVAREVPTAEGCWVLKRIPCMMKQCRFQGCVSPVKCLQ